MEFGKKNHHGQTCLLAPEAGADAEPKTAPETEADPLFEPRVDEEEEVLTVSAGLEPRPVPSPDFAVEEVVGVGVLTLTLVPFTCDSAHCCMSSFCCCCCCCLFKGSEVRQ